MSANNPQAQKSGNDLVHVSDWVACVNSNDGIIAVYCTVTTTDSSASITGAGLILNTSKGQTLVSSYTEMTGGSSTVTPSINVPPGNLKVGDSVMAVVSGECQDHHYFFEEEVTITTC